MPPALKALVAQAAGWIAAYGLMRAGWLPAGLVPFAAAQALVALGTAAVLHSARWWLPIHLAFTPAALALHRAGIAPGWYLAGFAALLAVYWTSFRTQVPLFLTSRRTVAAVAELLPAGRPLRVLDLGSGTGSLLRPLAEARPESRFTGIEAAPAPLLVGRLLARGQSNLEQRRGNFFDEPWSDYDVVYAFLSPAPMQAVWDKAVREMRPGALLISNSFAVPGAEAAREIDAAVAGRPLFVYRPGHAASTSAKRRQRRSAGPK